MKKFVLAAALVTGATLGLESSAFAHGGQYRGPGDTVPPGGGGSGGGGAGSPGPSGPSSPGPGGPSSPGPGGPGAPGGAGGAAAAPVSGGGGGGGPDLTGWPFWWEFNKEPYLNLKSAIHSGGTKTGSDSWFLGHGEQEQGKDSMRPSEAQIREKVVPALKRALETETNNDIVTGSLIALAKIGDVKSEGGDSEFEKIIAKELTNKNQEISETAAVSLGILANPASIETLVSLMTDSPAGRSLVGQGEVPFRTRSFAAYGLALIGAAPETSEVQRQTIVRALVDQIQTDDTKSRDLKVACLVSLGLVPLETIEPAEPPTEGEPLDPSSCRIAQMDYLIRFLEDDDNRFLVRAHAPTALARLLENLPSERYGEYKEKIAKDLLERIGKRSKEPKEVVQSAVLALGLIGDLDSDPIDKEIRKALSEVTKDQADQLARNFSMIAMGKVGGTRGSGEKIEDGIKDASKFLTKNLTDGKSQIVPWAGLGIGVMGRKLAEAGVTSGVVTDMQAALRSTLDDEKGSRVGAYSIACGILQDQEAESILLEKLDRIKDDETRGYVAVSLGLMGARDAIAPIQKIVKDAKYRPDLLKQAAIALGLLGDKELVNDLATMLTEAKSLATQAALSSALGFIGDQRSIDPLVEMLENKDLTELARGFAAVALGIVADKEILPWNSKIAVDLNYTASTTTLNDQEGTGILNIL